MNNGKPDGKSASTTVGKSIVIRGKLKSDEDLVVKGRIDAQITSSKALYVENSGIVKANLQVHSAHISGILVGNITAESKAEVAGDGRMVGDILAPRIVIRDGAAFRGRIDMQDFDEVGREAHTSSGQSVTPPSPVVQRAVQETPPSPTSSSSPQEDSDATDAALLSQVDDDGKRSGGKRKRA